MIIAILIIGTLLAVAVTSVIAVVALCVWREEHQGELSHQAPTRTADIVRRLTGLRVCQPSDAYLCKMQRSDYTIRHADRRPAAAGLVPVGQEPAVVRNGHAMLAAAAQRYDRRPA
jgi:hypothetical protein